MLFFFICVHCGFQMELSSVYFGKMVKCEKCGKEFRALFYVPKSDDKLGNLKSKKIRSNDASAANEKQKKAEKNIAVSLLLSILGSGAAALIGGAVWGVLSIVTGHVFMIIAMGIGVICGFAVIQFSNDKKNICFQIIAVISSMLGIITGNYISFFYSLKKILPQLSIMDMFSKTMIRLFVENISSVIGLFDILCIIVAIFLALEISFSSGRT